MPILSSSLFQSPALGNPWTTVALLCKFASNISYVIFKHKLTYINTCLNLDLLYERTHVVFVFLFGFFFSLNSNSQFSLFSRKHCFFCPVAQCVSVSPLAHILLAFVCWWAFSQDSLPGSLSSTAINGVRTSAESHTLLCSGFLYLANCFVIVIGLVSFV